MMSCWYLWECTECILCQRTSLGQIHQQQEERHRLTTAQYSAEYNTWLTRLTTAQYSPRQASAYNAWFTWIGNAVGQQITAVKHPAVNQYYIITHLYHVFSTVTGLYYYIISTGVNPINTSYPRHASPDWQGGNQTRMECRASWTTNATSRTMFYHISKLTYSIIILTAHYKFQSILIYLLQALTIYSAGGQKPLEVVILESFVELSVKILWS